MRKLLESRRLILRHQEPEDLDALYALYCDPEVIKYIPDAPQSYHDTREELEWYLQGYPKSPQLGLWATIYKETGKYIGLFGLLPVTMDEQDEVELAFIIHRDFWGQGLGTEGAQAILEYGFEKLGLSRLICLMDKDNMAAIRVAEKIGLSFEKKGKDNTGPFMLYARNKPHIRSAKPEEAEFLSGLAFRSKAFWGYPPDFMEACREELAVSRDHLENKTFHYRVAELNGTLVGYYCLEQLSPSTWELDALFVEPALIGQGFGRLLIEHAKRAALVAGAKELLIQSDPYAADFYRAAGGEQVGERESVSIPGRYLPLFIIKLHLINNNSY